MMEQRFGRTDATLSCAKMLADGFRCLYDRNNAGDCTHAPRGSYYDNAWGGIASVDGFENEGCFGAADFGNACYNDHHYHFGYFVVAGAVLVKLLPEYADNADFVNYVETLMRDTSNPSKDDHYFPRFRTFDWFDLHSWSRGVVPSPDGKDQESTSEELNLLYGMHLWGKVLKKPAVSDLGSTMLSLATTAVKEFFLMTKDNPNHHPDFAANHVTGIFFQNKVDYNTWFGNKAEFIHGIQMLPLTPALLLSRTPEFCREEWEDILKDLPLDKNDPWTSILLTGGLALVDPSVAYEKLLEMHAGHMDDGLTRAWGLFWIATQEARVNLATLATKVTKELEEDDPNNRTLEYPFAANKSWWMRLKNIPWLRWPFVRRTIYNASSSKQPSITEEIIEGSKMS